MKPADHPAPETWYVVQATPRQETIAREHRSLVRQGAFAGMEGVYAMSDGGERAVVMLELLGRQCRVKFALVS